MSRTFPLALWVIEAPAKHEMFISETRSTSKLPFFVIYSMKISEDVLIFQQSKTESQSVGGSHTILKQLIITIITYEFTSNIF